MGGLAAIARSGIVEIPTSIDEASSVPRSAWKRRGRLGWNRREPRHPISSKETS
jgi:hypothetical protein